ncbi:hypothetical protein [Motiliproteus sediminis]|uniref:hypothetical protein n=1 Tax=Motiliproteus sediminis TaxID=1468178 RepID=UPI001AEF7812|nr:hypothetical protein [Motiliproteus sediminis]
MKRALTLAATLLLSACQHQLQPQPAAPSAAVAAAETSARVEQQLQSQQQAIASVENRLTLLQEQTIKSNQNLAQLQQRAQQQLVALQQLQMLLAAQPQESQQDNGALEQLAMMVDRLEQMSASAAASTEPPRQDPAGPQYRLASTYTDQGVWVIFKYDEVTGLTWSAVDGRWNEVEESDMLPVSRYQVVLRPASKDVKGYVAARIDQQSGRTWWLNGNRWEAFQ